MVLGGANACSSDSGADDPQNHEEEPPNEDIDLGQLIRCDGELIDPNTNPMYCGASGDNCESKGSVCEPGTSCQKGVCKLGCIEGQVLCDGKCIIPESDNIYCGASGDKCENRGESCGHGTSCQNGTCEQGCVTGQVLCDGKCITPETDNMYCGASGDCTGANKGEACGDGTSCQLDEATNSYKCMQGCVQGQILCNGQCITPGSSNLYCGAKGSCVGNDKDADDYQGEACGDGTSCKQGECKQGCIAGQILCNGQCITPGEDNTYCGAKGNCMGDDKDADDYQGEACGDGTSCRGGVCKQGCIAGQILCNGQCITPGSSNLYCGAKGNCTGDDSEADDYQGEACGDGTSCKQGTCQQGCVAGQILCNGQCITPGTSNLYCGAKGNCTGDDSEADDYQGEACGDGTSCKGGVCKQGCIAGQILCNGQCITPGSSNLYCGAKGNCTGDDKDADDYQGEACGDGTSCKGGTCQQGCIAGQILCDGQCITPGTDNLYCGASGDCQGDNKGKACNDGTSCKGGVCQQGCIAGQILCDGQCITPGTDNLYCGASGDCQGDNKGKACDDGTSCKGGVCQQGCIAGQILCDGKCITPSTDNLYCGASGDCKDANKGKACGDGTSCKGGVCQQGCVAGQILCDGKCITPGTDNLYCGASGDCKDANKGEACGDGTSCKQGTCQQGCVAGQILCDGKCITPGTDNQYCGASGDCKGANKGEACGDGTSCKGGTCQRGCVAGQILCDGQCITPGTDNQYCGASGACQGVNKGEACGDGTSCKGGTCQQGCIAGQILCDGKCITPATDNLYCGASGDCQGNNKGHACGDGTSCKQGSCQQGCVAGQVLCDGQCIVPGTDNQYCGASGDCQGNNKGEACGDGTSCKQGTCQQGCIAGQILCDGKCITPSTDNQYCGASGNCTGANKGEACGDGTSCKQGTCQQGCVAGQVLCDGQCIVPGTDNQYCGASGNCQGNNKGEACGDGTSCKQGTCQQGCIAGQILCDGKCITPATDNLYCGASGDCQGNNKGHACGDGTSCKQGTCQQGCVAGQVLCDGQCIVPGTDNQYCGASGDCQGNNKGEACGDGTSCKQGTCQQGCIAGQILCDGKCITPSTDNLYCGASGDCQGNNKGQACGDGTSCKQGTCQQGCVAGQVLCDGQCIVPGTDNQYCGASGNCQGNNRGEACGDGTSCKQGTCQQGCIAGQILCDGKCITPATDNLYCGASGDCQGNNKGQTCGDGTSCKGGVCKQGCIAGQILCDGQCITPGTDNLYCGASDDCRDIHKGAICEMGTSCKQGSCQQGCIAGQILCDGQCITPSTDNLYCGASGNCQGNNRGQACSEGTSCKQGTCQQGCIAGQILCDGKCITPATDNQYCGASGNCQGNNKGAICGDGTSCKQGTCKQGCIAGQILCDGRCITPGTDMTYCGASGDCQGNNRGQTCPDGYSCKAGECKAGCVAQQVLCNGVCISSLTDMNYCGAKGSCNDANPSSANYQGQACESGYSCQNGTCKLGCTAGTVACSGTCIKPLEDNTYCGAKGACNDANSASLNFKGQACAQGTKCIQGKCQKECAQNESRCIINQEEGCFSASVLAILNRNSNCNCKSGITST